MMMMCSNILIAFNLMVRTIYIFHLHVCRCIPRQIFSYGMAITELNNIIETRSAFNPFISLRRTMCMKNRCTVVPNRHLHSVKCRHNQNAYLRQVSPLTNVNHTPSNYQYFPFWHFRRAFILLLFPPRSSPIGKSNYN